VIFISAIGARLDPKYKYLTSRWMGEQELAKTGVNGTILRFSLMLAEEGGTLDFFERTAKFGPVIVIPGTGQAQFQPILREDAARCIVDTIGRADLLGKIIELGGPEVIAWETIYDWFLQARNIRKPKLHVMPQLLIPGAMAMEALFTDPVVTADEVRTSELPNLAEGIDSISTRYGFRPTAPSTWAPMHWKKGAR
jgi:NAD dependent epimerase/dehydratase family enzyme